MIDFAIGAGGSVLAFLSQFIFVRIFNDSRNATIEIGKLQTEILALKYDLNNAFKMIRDLEQRK